MFYAELPEDIRKNVDNFLERLKTININVKLNSGQFLGAKHECVFLVRRIYPNIGPTNTWKRDNSVKDRVLYSPLATLVNGTGGPNGDQGEQYGPGIFTHGHSGYSHTGIYVGQDSGGIYLFNQYNKSNGAVISYYKWKTFGIDNHGNHFISRESGVNYYPIAGWRKDYDRLFPK